MTVRLCFPKSYHLQIPAFACDHSSIKLFFLLFYRHPKETICLTIILFIIILFTNLEPLEGLLEPHLTH